MNTAAHPAASVAANVMRVEADLVLIGKIVAAFKATDPQHMTWATAADTARLASMTRDVIDVFGAEAVQASASKSVQKRLAVQTAQPAQEPAAWVCKTRLGVVVELCLPDSDDARAAWDWEPLYTAPPQPVPLTDEQKSAIQQWLDFGEQMQHGGHQQGYFSRGGWAYDTLRGIGGKP